MFWKKRNDNIIDFTYVTDDKRQAFRVKPPPDFPPVILFENHEKLEVAVKDISAGGIAFYCSDQEYFTEGQEVKMSIRLPRGKKDIPVVCKILGIDPEGIFHTCFQSLEEKAYEKIYRYVLSVEKRLLR
ncbi:MAG: PilZ domain-containing protein [bacterium]|nr:PilZ domain-containing protein [bacterium]